MGQNFKGKKLLILGGSALEIEIVNAARSMGLHTIITDYNTDWRLASAKYEADEAWNISWADIDALAEMCEKQGVDGCLAGFSERIITSAQQLCSVMGYPFYTDGSDLEVITDKIKFKNACIESGVTVPKSYNLDDGIIYPVIVKPADNAGSRGITICYTNEELEQAYKLAKEFSDTERVLIEEYITSDEVMIYYTVHDGEVALSAMCDLINHSFDKNTTQLQSGIYYPSKYLSVFKETSNHKFQKLIEDLNIQNGLIAFQTLVVNDDFLPYDPTYRLDTTMTYHFVEHLNGINVLKMLISYSLTGSMGDNEEIRKKENPEFNKICFKLPILLKEGTISAIEGLEEVNKMESVINMRQSLTIGDVCDKPADYSQLFCRIQMIFNDESELEETIEKIYDTLKVLDENGNSMILRA